MYMVICTAPTDSSRAIARRLVTERLAACVNIAPGITSMYLWEGGFVEDEEEILFIKVSKEGFPALAERLKEIHPYTVPEVVALDPAQVDAPYLQWVNESCGEKR